MSELDFPGWLEEELLPRPRAVRGRRAWSLSRVAQLAAVVGVASTLTVSAITGVVYATNLAGNIRALTVAVEKLEGTLERQEARTAALGADVAELRARAAGDEHTADNLDRRVSSLELSHARE